MLETPRARAVGARPTTFAIFLQFWKGSNGKFVSKSWKHFWNTFPAEHNF
jgi:hypothetical protein